MRKRRSFKVHYGSKRGMVLVEAALIWPLIFLSAAFVLYASLALYTQAVVSSAFHHSQRQACGHWTETIWYDADKESEADQKVGIEACAEQSFSAAMRRCPGVSMQSLQPASFQPLAVYPKLILQYEHDYRGGPLVPESRIKVQESTRDIVDEAQLILNYNYAVEWMKKKEGEDVPKQE